MAQIRYKLFDSGDDPTASGSPIGSLVLDEENRRVWTNGLATDADLADAGSGGGGGSDPLHLVNELTTQTYVAIGAIPAGSGALRVEADGEIVSASAAADLGNSGWTGGDQSLISLQTLDFGGGGDGRWSVIRLGDASGPLGKEIIYDPFWNGMLAALQHSRIGSFAATDYSNPDHMHDLGSCVFDDQGYDMTAPLPAEGFGSDAVFATIKAFYYPTAGSVTPIFGAFGVLIDNAETGAAHLTFSIGSTGFQVHNSGLSEMEDLQLNALPSSLPGLPIGRLWYDPADGNRVKYVSA